MPRNSPWSNIILLVLTIVFPFQHKRKIIKEFRHKLIQYFETLRSLSLCVSRHCISASHKYIVLFMTHSLPNACFKFICVRLVKFKFRRSTRKFRSKNQLVYFPFHYFNQIICCWPAHMFYSILPNIVWPPLTIHSHARTVTLYFILRKNK